MLTKLSFVSGGLGIALIPGSMRVVRLDNVAYLEIDAGKTPLGYSLALAAPIKSTNPAITAFVATASRYAGAGVGPWQR
jgi:DNA-binding transcriptional LysR family regulator